MNLKKIILLVFITLTGNYHIFGFNFSDTLKLKKMNDDTVKINFLNTIADEFKDFNSELGIFYAQKALDLSLKINYKSGIALAYKALGVNYYRMGIYDASLNNSLKAIEIFTEIKDKKQLCKTLNNIGLVYLTRENFTLSKQYFQNALNIAIQIKDEIEKSRILHNISIIEVNSGNIKSALNYNLQSLQLAKKHNNKALMIYNNISLSNCYLQLNEYNYAYSNIIEAIDNAKQLNNPTLSGIAYNQLAFFYLKLDNIKETIKSAEEAYKIGESNKNNYLRLESLNIITEAYKKSKDYKSAFEYSTRVNSLADSMKNESNIKSIAYIEAKHEYDKKIKEIEINKQQELKYSGLIAKIAILFSLLLLIIVIILYQFYRLKSKTNSILINKNKEIIELNKSLQHTNSTKDKFFSIIAHDLKGPFNSILGFSELLSEQIKEKDLDGIENYADVIHKSSQNALSLLTNLLEWSRSQTGRMEFIPEYIELNSLIDENLALLDFQARQKSISIKKSTPKIITLKADKSMLSTILRNLISNAIKFTNINGEIVIKAEKSDNQTIISVKDNGIGLTNEEINKLFKLEESFSNNGTQNEKGTGLGLLLCKEFVDKHEGKIWVESNKGLGSTFYFTLSI